MLQFLKQHFLSSLRSLLHQTLCLKLYASVTFLADLSTVYLRWSFLIALCLVCVLHFTSKQHLLNLKVRVDKTWHCCSLQHEALPKLFTYCPGEDWMCRYSWKIFFCTKEFSMLTLFQIQYAFHELPANVHQVRLQILYFHLK